MPSPIQDRDFAVGEVLFREGDVGTIAYVIRTGSVRLFKEVGGSETTVAQAGSGELVGAGGVVCDGKQTTTAVATAPTSCLLVDGPMLEQLIAGDVEISLRVIKTLAKQLCDSHRLIDELTAREGPAAEPMPPTPEPEDDRGRVLFALVRLAEASTERDDKGIWIKKRLADIGKELEVSETVVADVSKELMRGKLIRIRRDGVLVPDLPRMYGFVKSVDS